MTNNKENELKDCPNCKSDTLLVRYDPEVSDFVECDTCGTSMRFAYWQAFPHPTATPAANESIDQRILDLSLNSGQDVSAPDEVTSLLNSLADNTPEPHAVVGERGDRYDDGEPSAFEMSFPELFATPAPPSASPDSNGWIHSLGVSAEAFCKGTKMVDTTIGWSACPGCRDCQPPAEPSGEMDLRELEKKAAKFAEVNVWAGRELDEWHWNLMAHFALQETLCLIAERDGLARENEGLREGLEHYADKNHWHCEDPYFRISSTSKSARMTAVDCLAKYPREVEGGE